MTAYSAFLARKAVAAPAVGREVKPGELHPSLHDFQRDIVTWGVRTGRCGFWTDTGTGKSRMSLAWAAASGDTTLVVAPLGVAQQTVREAARLDMEARYVRSAEQVTGPGVWVTNYEMVDRFDPSTLDCVVLDEASILRDATGTMRSRLIEQFAAVPRKLSCTATPAPNAAEELTNQAAFLGVATRPDMLAAYFVHDDDGWRVKQHARQPMFDWMATWACCLRTPADLGYPDDAYRLPGLDIVPQIVQAHVEAEGQLFATDMGGVSGQSRVRKQTLPARCQRAAELVDAERGEQWLLWCGLNDEATTLAKLIPGAVNVHGSMSPDEKSEMLLAFADGEISTLVTKTSIAGHGLNFQGCRNMAFVGLGYSWESYYQAIRRCYRYGQTRIVRAHLVLSELEQQIAGTVARKEREAEHIRAGMVAAMRRTHHHAKGVAA